MALVRLWVLASDSQTLNRWESSRRVAGFAERVKTWEHRLDAEAFTLEECNSEPLELIQAVDRILWHESAATAYFERPYQEAGRSVWLWRVGTKGRDLARTTRKIASPAAWFNYHVIAPTRTTQGIDVKVKVATSALASGMGEMAKQKVPGLKIWVAHFDDNCKVLWDRSKSPAGRVRATGFDDDSRRLSSVIDTMDRASQDRAKVVVMPELSVDPAMRRKLVAWLESHVGGEAPFILVAGSFHEQLGEQLFNTSPMIDGQSGDELLKHRKLRPYGSLGAGDEADVAEDISLGHQFQILGTDLGTFGILICKDFLDADVRIAGLLQEVPVDWILVPSYGSERTLQAHLRKAKDVSFVTVGCNVVLANIRNVGLEDGVSLPGFLVEQGTRQARNVGAVGGVLLVNVQLAEAPARLKRVK